MFNEINKNIVVTLGINKLPIEQQKEAMERLGTIVYQEVMIRVLDILSEKDKDEFEKIVSENPNPENLFDFLSSKIPNIEDIVVEESKKLQDEAKEILEDIGK